MSRCLNVTGFIGNPFAAHVCSYCFSCVCVCAWVCIWARTRARSAAAHACLQASVRVRAKAGLQLRAIRELNLAARPAGRPGWPAAQSSESSDAVPDVRDAASGGRRRPWACASNQNRAGVRSPVGIEARPSRGPAWPGTAGRGRSRGAAAATVRFRVFRRGGRRAGQPFGGARGRPFQSADSPAPAGGEADSEKSQIKQTAVRPVRPGPSRRGPSRREDRAFAFAGACVAPCASACAGQDSVLPGLL